LPHDDIARRELRKGLSSVAASAAFGNLNVVSTLDMATASGTDLPRKQEFDLGDGFTFLNAAYTHPIPRGADDARSQTARTADGAESQTALSPELR
jgi:hypothetical protein